MVGSWLDRHHALLRGLISAGWTWAQLATAMNAAGVTYEAGKALRGDRMSRGAWTAGQLQRDAQRAYSRVERHRTATRDVLKEPEAHTEPTLLPSPASLLGKVGQLAGPAPDLQPEPGILERQAAAKAAETQRIVSSFLNRRKQGGDQKG